MKIKNNLNGNLFIDQIKSCFCKVSDKRDLPVISMEDALMSAFALFQLKFPSLLKFETARKNPDSNLNRIYKISQPPSDTRMREIIDPVDPAELRAPFKRIFSKLQEAKVLENFKFLGDHYLISSDGTGTFSSDKVHCDCCLEKYNKKSEKTTYQHQCLTAALVHPEQKIVIPFAPEIIKKEDGFSKNDCELNASKRLWIKFREDHPKLKAIVLEDALVANTPHIKHLKLCQLSFIITAKEGNNSSLFNAVKARESSLKDVEVITKTRTEGQKIKKSIVSSYRFVNRVPLSQQKDTVSVNFLELIETKSWINAKGEEKKDILKYAWITDIDVTLLNVVDIAQAGRCRWKIENETFNTLKNQGYNFEHNYGHGYLNLSSNFTHLMLLAFLFDQALEGFCGLYSELRKITGTRYSMWEAMRAIYRYFEVNDWNHFIETVLCKELNTC
jgi:hypothetical protein